MSHLQFIALIFGIGVSWGSLITKILHLSKEITKIEKFMEAMNKEHGVIKERLAKIEGILSNNELTE